MTRNKLLNYLHVSLSPHTMTAVLLGVCSATILVSLRTQAGAEPQNAAVKKKRAVEYSADQYSGISATGIQTMTGNVRFTSDATVMRTALAQYNYNTSVAVAPGTIQINDERNTLVGNSGKAFYKTGLAIIQGGVRIVVRPKAGSSSAPKGSARREFKDPVTILCDRVDYYWRNQIAVATGHLVLKQNTSEGVTRTATAKKLTYYTTNERLILDGDVDAVDSKGQKLKGPLATVIIREGAEEFRMEKGVQGVIIIEDEDDPAAPPPLLPAPVATPVVPPTLPEAEPVPIPPSPVTTPTIPKATP